MIGLATVTERIGEAHVGKTHSFVMSFVTAGLTSGPMTAGFLYERLGYWPAWTAPFVVLSMDFILRLIMIDNPKRLPPASLPGVSVTAERDELSSTRAHGRI